MQRKIFKFECKKIDENTCRTYSSFVSCGGDCCGSGISSFSSSDSAFTSSLEGIGVGFEGVASLFVEADFVGRFLAALLIRSSNSD